MSDRSGQLVYVATPRNLSVSKATTPPSLASWQAVNRSEQQVTINASNCCLPGHVNSSSAIDAFYGSVAEVMKLGDPQALAQNETLGRLLILGIVTVTETYFRSVIAAMVRLCPLAGTCASDQQIAFGALEFYGASELGLSLLEGISFTSTSEVKKATKSLLGLELTADESLMAALESFNQVCSMRHAVVHDHGRINRGNAKVLGLRPQVGRSLRLVVDLPNFHTAASACTNVVRAYNGFLWRRTIQRWIDAQLLRGEWQLDKDNFGRLFRLLHSSPDNTGPSNAYRAYLSVRPSIAKRLANQSPL